MSAGRSHDHDLEHLHGHSVRLEETLRHEHKEELKRDEAAEKAEERRREMRATIDAVRDVMGLRPLPPPDPPPSSPQDSDRFDRLDPAIRSAAKQSIESATFQLGGASMFASSLIALTQSVAALVKDPSMKDMTRANCRARAVERHLVDPSCQLVTLMKTVPNAQKAVLIVLHFAQRELLDGVRAIRATPSEQRTLDELTASLERIQARLMAAHDEFMAAAKSTAM